jgi:hypothetical protein
MEVVHFFLLMRSASASDKIWLTGLHSSSLVSTLSFTHHKSLARDKVISLPPLAQLAWTPLFLAFTSF